MAQNYSFKVRKNIVKDAPTERIARRARRKTSRLATALGLALIGLSAAALIATLQVMSP
jgi:ABC-type lipoprotein release transport system permease subunit